LIMVEAHKTGAVQRKRRPQRRAAAPVEVTRVHPDALALADSDIRRVRVVDAGTMLVRN
jgi:hypothetical protein